ncbi:hypothetical protein P692DRAFT_20878315 [Suillus brevipes Sb2]|nr:hypothetical protein P692DRAFT_20878315 [Suillus brevipes Sb2]
MPARLVAGTHKRKRSHVRQCGCKGDAKSVKVGAYGRGGPAAVVVCRVGGLAKRGVQIPHVLTDEGVPSPSTLAARSPVNQACKWLATASMCETPMLDGRDNKSVEISGERDGWEQQMLRGENTSGRCICGVVVAGNVAEMEGREGVLGVQEELDPPENEVSGPVATPAIAPPINNALVVAMDPEVGL